MPHSDKWPPYEIGSHEHLHAVGVVVAAWNQVETAYQTMIQLIFPHHMKAGIHAFELLGNDQRVKLISAGFSEIATAQELDLLRSFLKHANICKDYRNVLCHAGYPNQPPGELIVMSNGTSKDRSNMKLTRFTVAGIREMADTTYATAKFGFDLWSAVNLRISNASWLASGVTPRFLPSLPKSPPQPRSWEQIRES